MLFLTNMKKVLKLACDLINHFDESCYVGGENLDYKIIHAAIYVSKVNKAILKIKTNLKMFQDGIRKSLAAGSTVCRSTCWPLYIETESTGE